ncbi:MAG: THUMP domain-containing protein [Polyangiaceae bacterium]
MRFFATAAKGTEPALRDELREMRLTHVRADRGGVHFEGDLVDAARACLWSRVAVRVLLEISSFEARGERPLYDGVRAVEWDAWMTPRTTLSVRATCRSSRLTHSHFVAQKTKDAIVDGLRHKFGSRPSVDRDDPDVGVAIRLARDNATLYLDVGGASLHERGWRTQAGVAPLRETLAAAVVRLSGWDRERPFMDPMCGAGTIAIEAAALARSIAPGLSRSRFGFERWASYGDTLRAALIDLRESARASAKNHGPLVLASDADPRAVEWTRANARRAGVDIVTLRRGVGEIEALEPPGLVVSNPPYGERLDLDPTLYAEMARGIKSLRGHSVALLAGTSAIARAMGRPPDRFFILYNGAIECRLLVYG